jgi:hypothetical protein
MIKLMIITNDSQQKVWRSQALYYIPAAEPGITG